MLICPVCHTTLQKTASGYTCVQGHHFDISKEGYTNLLIGNKKKHGDDTIMIRARRDFLNTGLYTPLLDVLADLITTHTKPSSLCIADIGCGEGRYMRGLNALRQKNDSFFGVDISKDAIRYAAKNTPGTLVVGNVHTLPFADNSCDVMVCVFSPYHETEIQRCLKPDGIALIVGPGLEHLYAFITLIRDNPHHHILKETTEKYSHLELVITTSLQIPLSLHNNTDIVNLFTMTPYYRKAPKEKQEAILQLETFETTADFMIDVVRK